MTLLTELKQADESNGRLQWLSLYGGSNGKLFTGDGRKGPAIDDGYPQRQ